MIGKEIQLIGVDLAGYCFNNNCILFGKLLFGTLLGVDVCVPFGNLDI